MLYVPYFKPCNLCYFLNYYHNRRFFHPYLTQPTVFRPTTTHSLVFLSMLFIWTDVGENQVNHIFDYGGRWVYVMWEVMGHRHLPGIQHLHVESSEHGTQHSINLYREPVTAKHAAPSIIYPLKVGSADHHQSSRLTVQQMNHCLPDISEVAYIHLYGVSVKVSPHTKKNNCVWPTLDPVQLICYITQLWSEHWGGAHGWPMKAELYQLFLLSMAINGPTCLGLWMLNSAVRHDEQKIDDTWEINKMQI